MKLFQLPIALFLCSLLFVQLVKGQVEGELDAEDGLGGNDMTQKAEEEALGGEGLPEGTMPDEGGLDDEQQQPSDITNLENEGGDSGLGLQRDPTEELANSEVSQSSTFDAPTGSVDDAGTMENVPEEPILQQEAQAEETPEVQVAEPEQAKLEPSSNNKGKTDGAAKTDPQHKQEKAAETGKPERTKIRKKR
uniref:Uncharacterized protein n=1 Tax=Ditylenchus dipsaci TaxID=166011 RepID=A0A915EB67_9BILA